MKNYIFYLIALTVFSFTACSDSDGGSCSDRTETLSVIVQGAEMTNIAGNATVGSENISINIGGDSSNDSRVFFSCPNAVGTYDLKLDLSGGDSQTVTAFVPAEAFNIILTTGCFEIVSIGESEVVMRFSINEDTTSLMGEIALEVI